MKHWTHFAYRIDQWTDDGESIVEHVADVQDFQVAMATYHAAWFAAAEPVGRRRLRCAFEGPFVSEAWRLRFICMERRSNAAFSSAMRL